MQKIKKNYKVIIGIIIGVMISLVGVHASNAISSSDISYDNSKSGLTSTNLKGAIDELNEKANNKGKIINLDIGDIIQFGTEKFYVISYDDEYIEILAMYNLNVGYNWYNDRGWWLNGASLIQNKNCIGEGGVKGQVYDSNSSSSGGPVLIEVVYDSTCTDNEGYNSGNPSYFSTYKQHIKDKIGVDVVDIRYLNSNDLLSLGCTEGTDSQGNKMAKDCSQTGYSWLYSTTYFLGDELYYYGSSSERTSMFTDGHVNWRLASVGSGYRPVIKVKRNLIN